MKIVALPKLTFLVLAFLDGFGTSAQDASLVGRKTLSLQVGLNQSVSVRFPKPITSVDRGSSLLLARKVPTVENVLLLKAGAATMPPTSLMVILSDGSLYSFQVHTAVRRFRLASNCLQPIHRTHLQPPSLPANNRSWKSRSPRLKTCLPI
jgi:hypothetical protein